MLAISSRKFSRSILPTHMTLRASHPKLCRNNFRHLKDSAVKQGSELAQAVCERVRDKGQTIQHPFRIGNYDEGREVGSVLV